MLGLNLNLVVKGIVHELVFVLQVLLDLPDLLCIVIMHPVKSCALKPDSVWIVLTLSHLGFGYVLADNLQLLLLIFELSF